MTVEIRCVPMYDVRFCEAVGRAFDELSDVPIEALRIACRRRLEAIREAYPHAEVRVGEVRDHENHTVYVFRDGSPTSSEAL